MRRCLRGHSMHVLRLGYALALLPILTLCLRASPAVAAPAEASSCLACHGANGVSTDQQVPTIAGMSDAYLEAQMIAYQKGQRPCVKMPGADMCDIAKKLNAVQIKSIGGFFAAQKFVAAKQSISPALAARGKALHDAHCAVCHSSGGGEPADDAGILAGQWQGYLAATLQDYLAGKRAAPDPMKHQISTLSQADLQALAAYYASEGSK